MITVTGGNLKSVLEPFELLLLPLVLPLLFPLVFPLVLPLTPAPEPEFPELELETEVLFITVVYWTIES